MVIWRENVPKIYFFEVVASKLSENIQVLVSLLHILDNKMVKM